MKSKQKIKLFTKRLEIRPYTLQDYQNWKEGYLGRLPGLILERFIERC